MQDNGHNRRRPGISVEKYQKHLFDPLRIESITEQLRQISYSGCRSVLEIGAAGGFLSHCLKLFPQVSHLTIDIAEALSPDCVASVTQMPFADDQFELIVCGQVLEHLPFAAFLPALRELRRVARHKVILSLPDITRHFGLAVCLARRGWFRWEWNPINRRCQHRQSAIAAEHYWEIGYQDIRAETVVKAIEQAGFILESQYRLWKHPWHRFFLLQV
ncbi:MAG: methyltransferase domain-containing protein [Sedimentisphaerales bacterium]|nr:methyltransferase domain-containing protein [Sedimentisphaerales bacterium]